MGAVTISNKTSGGAGVQPARGKMVEADVTFSASYATAGDTLDPKQLGLKGIREVLVPSHDSRTRKAVATAASRAGKTVELGGTESAPKLLVFDTANTEVANATNLSTIVLRLRFIGY